MTAVVHCSSDPGISSGRIKGLLLVVVAAGLVVTTESAHASPLPSTNTYATVLQDITSPSCNPDCFGTTLSTMTYTDFYNNHYLAAASAGFGSVGAEVSIQTGLANRGSVFAESQGMFTDNIVLGHAIGTGTVSFTVGLHGTALTTFPGVVDPRLDFVFGAGTSTASGRIDVHSLIDGYPSGIFTTGPIAYTFGDSISIFMVLTAGLVQTADSSAGGPLIANLLYGNTATLMGLTVLDENGVPISDYSITSGSGTHYFAAPPSATPIPGALPLFATGLGALGLLAKRRKRKNAATFAAA